MNRRAVRRAVVRLFSVLASAGVLAASHAPSTCRLSIADALAAPPPVDSPAAPALPAAQTASGVSDPLATSAPGAPVLPLSATLTASMSTVRWYHSAALLDDGRVLVAGGAPTGDSAGSAEIFDPATGQWTRTAPMLTAHDWPVVTRLCDGRVFVGGSLGPAREAEIYDPATDQWGSAGLMKYRHTYGVAMLLSDCRVLISGGYDALKRAEVFDPATGLYTAAGSMSIERFFHTSTVLADGRALIAGGGVDNLGVWYTRRHVDIWDPATFEWTKKSFLVRARRAHTATLLPDGRVLVAGGTDGGKNDGTDGGTQLGTAEIYDPGADLWTELEAKLVTPRGLHTAALLPTGAVMLLGGLDASGSASREVEIFHEGLWQRLDPLVGDRLHHASALLPSGAVLVMGGYHQATAELYTLGQPGDPCVTGAACAGGICADGVCCNEACGGDCRRCDLPGRAGTCSIPCADAAHVLGCPAGIASCDPGACVAVACAPYRCDTEQNGCLAGCTSVEDCAPGYACDLDGACVPPPDVSAADEACAAAPAGSDGPGAAPAAATLLAALGAVFRRRSARKRPRRTDPGARRSGAC